MAENSVAEISADHGPAVLVRLPHSSRLQRTTRRVEIPDLTALRKVAARPMAVVADPMEAAARLTAAVDPTAEANTAS